MTPMDPRIADYIRANRRKYTREAITKQLIEAGHDPAEIERTWAALETPDPDAVAGEGFWGRFALILIGTNLGVLLLVGFLTGALQNAAQGGLILLAILAVVLAIGALMAWGIVAATGPARLGRTTALVIGIAIPLLFALLIGGACYALLGGMGFSGGTGSPPVTGTMSIRLEGGLDVDEEADALCAGAGPGDLFVSSEVTSSDGRIIFVSIATITDGTGAAPRPTLNIELPPMTEEQAESFPAWGSDMGPAVEEIEWSIGGPAGSVTFSGLPGMDHGAAPAPSALPSLSGEISWTCE
jgi:hypothetical protein